MYIIPENINALKNAVVYQIAFGINLITLSFDKGFLQFSGKFAIQYDSTSVEYEEVYPVHSDYGLWRILEKKIVNVTLNEIRDALELEFEGGFILKLFSHPQYESFTLNIDGNCTII